MKKALFVLLCIIVSSCAERNRGNEKFRTVYSDKKIIFNQDIVDNCQKIRLDSINSSFVGNLFFNNNKFYFTDNNLCKVFIFDNEGTFLKNYLGKGKSDSEVDSESITGYTTLPNGANCVISSVRCILYDSSFSLSKSFILNVSENKDITPDNPSIYTMSYDKFTLKSYNDNIYYNMTLQHPSFNFIENPDNFYNNAKVIFITDYKTGKFVKMIGNYPESYAKGKYNQFSLANFDVNNYGNIYLSFEADEKIYVYDKCFNPEICFGIKGENMNTNYIALTSFEDFGKNYSSHRKTYSYYKDIKFIDGLNYIARIYGKDKNESDGLQLYDKKGTLLADLSIPKNHKIAGSDSRNLYLYKTDESEEKIDILKINLL